MPAASDGGDTQGPVSEGRSEERGTGYVPDRADLRDTTLAQVREDEPMAKSLGFPVPPLANRLSIWLDLGSILGPPVHQGPVECATAHVVTSMARWRIHALSGKSVPLSVLNLYNITRDLRGSPENRGVSFRETLKAFQAYGCIEERRWPYVPDWVDVAPRISDLKLAKPFSGMTFCRLDPPNARGGEILLSLLETLAAGNPVGFGLSVLKCFDDIDSSGVIPFPESLKEARLLAAQSVLATGYQVTDLSDPENPRGYLKIRNTWGPGWGKAGEAWLPFDYVEHQLAMDFWMIYGSPMGK